MRYEANAKDVYFFHPPLKGVTATKTPPYVKIAKDKKFVKTRVEDSPHFAFVKGFLELPKKSFLKSQAYKKYEEYMRIEAKIYGGEKNQRLHVAKKFMRLIGNFDFEKYSDGAAEPLCKHGLPGFGQRSPCAECSKWKPIRVVGIACFSEDHLSKRAKKRHFVNPNVDRPLTWADHPAFRQSKFDMGLTGVNSEFAHHSDGDDGMIKYELTRIYEQARRHHPKIEKQIMEWLDDCARVDLFTKDGLHRSAILAYYQKKIICRLIGMNAQQKLHAWNWNHSLGLRAGFKL